MRTCNYKTMGSLNKKEHKNSEKYTKDLIQDLKNQFEFDTDLSTEESRLVEDAVITLETQMLEINYLKGIIEDLEKHFES